jgi:NTE family protein
VFYLDSKFNFSKLEFLVLVKILFKKMLFMEQKDLENTKTYSEWLEIATELDRREGKLDWRKEEDSDLYHSSLLKEHLNKMKTFSTENKNKELLELILESLPRHSWELNNPELYDYARSGTKYLITDYFKEIESSIIHVTKNKIQGLTDKKKLELLKEGNRVHGQTVLMLSGGASFGIYHLGVTKALFENNLLPKIISGSSMGAIVAAAVCSRDDRELKLFFSNLKDSTHKVAIKVFELEKIVNSGSVLDPSQLLEHIEANVPNLSFLEAYKKSGRILNISVSATRKRQKPKVLNYLSAPNVMIQNSAHASCAIPGLFPPVSLQARTEEGKIIPYMENETWIDGSVHLDVPMQRIMRLHNVSRSIVSQANPHVLPFFTEKEKKGIIPFLADYIFSGIQFQAIKIMDLGVGISDKMPWLSALDKVRSMIEQDYRGDINISYPMTLQSLSHIAANPDENLFIDYIQKGERATWPKLAFIRDQMMLNRVLEDCISKLE